MSLNSLLTGTQSSTTTMPAWYDQAQQNIVKNAQTAANTMPSFDQTLGGQVVNQFSGTNNPFNTAQQGLQQIGAGAANPWNVDPSTGNVTPNTSTALGGLFSAQDAQLKRSIPGVVAPSDANAISGGQFGSLRNATAADTAIGNAQANLTSEQMKAALTGQQLGMQAYQGLGNLGSQQASTMSQLGQLQQAQPFLASSNLAQILNTIKAPATTTMSQTLPLAQQLGGLGSLLGAGTDVLGQIPGMLNKIGNLFPSSGSDITGPTYNSYAPGYSNYVPTDTSGSGGNYPSYLGTSSWDTSNWTPTDTTMSPNWTPSYGQSADYTGGGYDPNAYANAYSYDPNAYTGP
jgi:hypothetical protein